MRFARQVIDAIDDALVIHDRHPILFAAVSREGGNCLTLGLIYSAWLAGDHTIPSRYHAFNHSPSTLLARKRRRKANRAARRSRKANR
jgi:hypothetical protein